MRFNRVLLALGAGAILILSGGYSVAQFTGDWGPIDRKARQSLVFIETIRRSKDGSNQEIITGTGFIVDCRGHIVTASHVVPEARDHEEVFHRVSHMTRQRTPKLQVFGQYRDAQLDVALLLLPDSGRRWTSLEFGDPSSMEPGRPLYALGFPEKLDLSNAHGTLSSKTPGAGVGPRWQVTMAGLTRGFSGGPVLSTDGRVVGMVAAGTTTSPNINLMLPTQFLSTIRSYLHAGDCAPQKAPPAPKQQTPAPAQPKADGPAAKSAPLRDCPECPELVQVPAGSFMMGSPADEPQRSRRETQVKVTFARGLAVGRFAVTVQEFSAFAQETRFRSDDGCFTWMGSAWQDQPGRSWRSPGFQQANKNPVVCISWNDARAYVAWLSKKTGKSYRLLSEAEREYVTRAGEASPFWWGSTITPAQANYDGTFTYAGGGTKGEYRLRTLPVDSFKPNRWGLFNVHGNVWEWTEDCWNETHEGIASTGRARTSGDCGQRTVRGGSWNGGPQSLRAANRYKYSSSARRTNLGFRVAREL